MIQFANIKNRWRRHFHFLLIFHNPSLLIKPSEFEHKFHAMWRLQNFINGINAWHQCNLPDAGKALWSLNILRTRTLSRILIIKHPYMSWEHLRHIIIDLSPICQSHLSRYLKAIAFDVCYSVLSFVGFGLRDLFRWCKDACSSASMAIMRYHTQHPQTPRGICWLLLAPFSIV